PHVLDLALATFDDCKKADMLLALTERLRTLRKHVQSEPYPSLLEAGDKLKRQLMALVADHPSYRTAIARALSLINGTRGQPDSFNTLHRLLEAQAYRPAHWRAASSDINYRRFFDINNLAGLRVEDLKVFERTHEVIVRLAQ